MTNHVQDQDLLLAASTELPAPEAERVGSHLAGCERCRLRLSELERSMAEFRRFYRQELDSGLPAAGPALERLRARMADAATLPAPRGWGRTLGWLWRPELALAASVAAVIGIGALQATQQRGPRARVSRERSPAVPSPQLTPGATLPVTARDVCSVTVREQVPTVPDALQRQVFAAYGIKDPAPGAYEVDYLITPQLGGASSLRNLWPEPYFNTRWNARVKDALENRLHELVCSGQLDLATAQRDIARDWIAAYKKYFDTDQPLAATDGASGENTGSV